MGSPAISFAAMESAFADSWGGTPEVLWTSYAGAKYMADKLGITLPSTLIPDMPVMITKGKMETFYG